MIQYISHRIINDNMGIAIRFNINGTDLTRVSMLRHINNFAKNRLLWWKIGDDNYCDESQSEELEGILKAFVMPDLFKEQFLIEA